MRLPLPPLSLPAALLLAAAALTIGAGAGPPAASPSPGYGVKYWKIGNAVYGNGYYGSDWLCRADVVVGKAGPGTIAEAVCCAAPLVLTSFLPGQEEGNAEFVVSVGAGCYAPRPRDLAAEIRRLHGDPAVLAEMRAAAIRLARPDAAAGIGALLAGRLNTACPLDDLSGDRADITVRLTARQFYEAP
jgi:Glycosyltransferase family 28 C-terminal domain